MITNKLPKHDQYQSGFVALLSTLILAAVLVGMSLTLGVHQFYARGAELSGEFRDRATSLAESCAQIALGRIRADYSYTPLNEVVLLGMDACIIVSITNDPEDPLMHIRIATIRTSAGYRDSFSKIELKAKVYNPAYLKVNPATPAISILSRVEGY